MPAISILLFVSSIYSETINFEAIYISYIETFKRLSKQEIGIPVIHQANCSMYKERRNTLTVVIHIYEPMKDTIQLFVIHATYMKKIDSAEVAL